jgi:hypothetical protein
MTELELFNMIDEGIDIFKQQEGYQKRIKVNKKPHSNWLVFNWRQLSWKENNLEYSIEIHPNFDSHEQIISWTLGSAVHYDLHNKRFYLNNQLANKTTLQFIADNIVSLLVSSYNHITSIPKEEIPFGVHLKI